MIRIPFRQITHVEPYFGHSVYIGNTEYTIVGAEHIKVGSKNKVLYIVGVDEYGKELSESADYWFQMGKYKGERFGDEII